MGRFDLIEVTSRAGLTVFMFEMYSSQIMYISLRQMSIDRDNLSRV
jgi:hypothetical protein